MLNPTDTLFGERLRCRHRSEKPYIDPVLGAGVVFFCALHCDRQNCYGCFTCPKCGGVLVPDTSGWRCIHCGCFLTGPMSAEDQRRDEAERLMDALYR